MTNAAARDKSRDASGGRTDTVEGQRDRLTLTSAGRSVRNMHASAMIQDPPANAWRPYVDHACTNAVAWIAWAPTLISQG